MKSNKTILLNNPDPEFWDTPTRSLHNNRAVGAIVTASSKEEFESLLPQAHAVVSGRFQEQYIARATNMEALFVPFSGVNRFPLMSLQQAKVHVYNSHGAAQYVAERALALMLNLGGRVSSGDIALSAGIWHRRADSSMFWQSIRNATIGIVGTGAIGSALAALLAPFHSRIIGVNRSGRAQQGFDVVSTSLDALKGCEIIVIALPSTTETTALFTAELLESIAGALLVNVGRADAIVEKDLYAALTKGWLSGYASDVHYQYPNSFDQCRLPSAYPLHELDNVVLTPHTASHTIAARQANVSGAFDNLTRWLASDSSLEPVNCGREY